MYNNTTSLTTNQVGNNGNLAPIHIAEMLLTCVALTINIPLATIIVYTKKLRRIKSHQIFINIEIIHVIHSLVFIPARLNYPSPLYYVYAIISQGLLVELLLSMVSLTYERLLAVKYPLSHGNLNGKYVFGAICCSWLLPTIFVSLALYYRMTRWQYIIFGTVLLPVAGLTLSVANIAIYLLIKQHDAFVKNNAHKRSKHTSNRSILKPSYICFALVITFVLLWMPYFIRQLFLLFKVTSSEHTVRFYDIAVVIAHSNSLVDPLIFIYLSSPVKKKVKALFTRKNNCSSSSSVGTIVETGF